MTLFTINVTILNRFKTELPFMYLSNCISSSESRGKFRWLVQNVAQPIFPICALFVYMQRRRHGFLSVGVGSNRRQDGQPTPKIPYKSKKHRILATSFSNLGGGRRPPRFSKVRGSGPPGPPPRRRRPCVHALWLCHKA